MFIRTVLGALLLLSTACGGAVEGGPEDCGVAACTPDDRSPAPPAPPPAQRPPASTPAPPVDPVAECSSPYHLATDDNRCVWSCSEGTQPDDGTWECECRPGLAEVDTDRFGRRICR